MLVRSFFLSASGEWYNFFVETAAILEKYFIACSACSGLGLDKANFKNGATALRPSSGQACPNCRGTGVMLSLAKEDFVLSLPLFVDFSARRRRLFFKTFLILAVLVFLLGVPYLIFVNVADFWQSLKSSF